MKKSLTRTKLWYKSTTILFNIAVVILPFLAVEIQTALHNNVNVDGRIVTIGFILVGLINFTLRLIKTVAGIKLK